MSLSPKPSSHGQGPFNRAEFHESPTPDDIHESHGALYTRSQYQGARAGLLCRAYQVSNSGVLWTQAGDMSYNSGAWIVAYASQYPGHVIEFVWMPGVFEQNFNLYTPPKEE